MQLLTVSVFNYWKILFIRTTPNLKCGGSAILHFLLPLYHRPHNLNWIYNREVYGGKYDLLDLILIHSKNIFPQIISHIIICIVPNQDLWLAPLCPSYFSFHLAFPGESPLPWSNITKYLQPSSNYNADDFPPDTWPLNLNSPSNFCSSSPPHGTTPSEEIGHLDSCQRWDSRTNSTW